MTNRYIYLCLALTLLGIFSSAQAQTATSQRLLFGATKGAEPRLVPTSDHVTAAPSQDKDAPGILVTIEPSKEDYPGLSVKPAGVAWNLAAFGHIEAELWNTSTKPLTVSLRVDNAGDWRDNPWNTESVTLAPGKAGTVKTIFGYAYGQKPGYVLKPSAIVSVLLFTSKSDTAQAFRLVSLTAGGPAGEKPPVAPEDVRLKPKGGVLKGTTIPSADPPGVSVEPAVGRWDLRDYLEVRVQVRNDGTAPTKPRVRLESNGGETEWQTGTPLAPGSTEEIVVPFAGDAPADLSQKGSENHFTSDAVSGVAVAPSLHFLSAQAALPSDSTLPSWLGHRPPVPGEWVKTLDDEFNGTTLNSGLWNATGENYYDKQTHWSKADALVGGGLVRLRYEKKTGFQNDDPKRNQTPYAAGYLDTYGKWAQRYGYFEARMKLPTAPGLWPAFWMMPDRGFAAGPEQWKRQDTANGGMEFDIMEHLTRWGPHRYNIAMHYDGYGKDHKSLGSEKIYVQPDKDGFLTCGLLWTPSSAIYYCNGREVLRWTSPRISNVPALLIFTLPMGGWNNSPLDDARLPADFVIDYVRVWQRKDLFTNHHISSSRARPSNPAAPPSYR